MFFVFFFFFFPSYLQCCQRACLGAGAHRHTHGRRPRHCKPYLRNGTMGRLSKTKDDGFRILRMGFSSTTSFFQSCCSAGKWSLVFVARQAFGGESRIQGLTAELSAWGNKGVFSTRPKERMNGAPCFGCRKRALGGLKEDRGESSKLVINHTRIF